MDPRSFTLEAFFARRYLPTFLVGASVLTIADYRTTLLRWRQLTRNPSLDQCTVEDLASFKARLVALAGRRSTTLSPATANKHLRNVLALLGKAGPPGPRNRDALGLIRVAPWVKPLRTPRRSPRSIPIETLGAIYAAASVATLPSASRIAATPGPAPPATWWRALIVCAYNLGFRRGAWLGLDVAAVDWNTAALRLPAELDKRGVERIKPINATALAHLLRVRRAAGRLFPWPHAAISFDRTWHRIQRAAGLAPSQHFTFHDLKRTCGTQLAPIASAWQVRYMLDHAQPDVAGLYVDPLPALRSVVERMPQPAAFLGDDSNQLRLFA